MARTLKQIVAEGLLVLAGVIFFIGLVATVGIPEGRMKPAPPTVAAEERYAPTVPPGPLAWPGR